MGLLALLLVVILLMLSLVADRIVVFHTLGKNIIIIAMIATLGLIVVTAIILKCYGNRLSKNNLWYSMINSSGGFTEVRHRFLFWTYPLVVALILESVMVVYTGLFGVYEPPMLITVMDKQMSGSTKRTYRLTLEHFGTRGVSFDMYQRVQVGDTLSVRKKTQCVFKRGVRR